MHNVIHPQQGVPVHLSVLFNQCDDRDNRIDVECPEGNCGDSKNGTIASYVTPPEAPTMANLPL